MIDGGFGKHGEFLHAISVAESPRALADLVESETKAMGFEYYSYHVVRPEQGIRVPHFISNYPRSWGAHYGEQNFIAFDPVVAFSSQIRTPFLWSDLTRRQQLTKKQKQMMSDIGAIGITQGTTIPIHGPNLGLALLTVGNDASASEFAKMWDAYRFVLELATSRCHDVMTKFYPGSPDGRRIYALADRERECLLWASHGKTAWETGRILGLSGKTVENYITNAMTKLGVNTKIHAVVKAIVLGQITPNLEGSLVDFDLHFPTDD